MPIATEVSTFAVTCHVLKFANYDKSTTRTLLLRCRAYSRQVFWRQRYLKQCQNGIPEGQRSFYSSEGNFVYATQHTFRFVFLTLSHFICSAGANPTTVRLGIVARIYSNPIADLVHTSNQGVDEFFPISSIPAFGEMNELRLL